MRASYVIDVAANYSTQTHVDAPAEVLDEFMLRAALLVLWPYIRMGLSELTARLEGQGLLLGLYPDSSGMPAKNIKHPAE